MYIVYHRINHTYNTHHVKTKRDPETTNVYRVVILKPQTCDHTTLRGGYQHRKHLTTTVEVVEASNNNSESSEGHRINPAGPYTIVIVVIFISNAHFVES